MIDMSSISLFELHYTSVSCQLSGSCNKILHHGIFLQPAVLLHSHNLKPSMCIPCYGNPVYWKMRYVIYLFCSPKTRCCHFSVSLIA